MTISFGIAISDRYDELADMAEDICNILRAVADQHLDLSPTTEAWLLEQLEQIESMLRTLDELRPRATRHALDGTPAEAAAGLPRPEEARLAAGLPRRSV